MAFLDNVLLRGASRNRNFWIVPESVAGMEPRIISLSGRCEIRDLPLFQEITHTRKINGFFGFHDVGALARDGAGRRVRPDLAPPRIRVYHKRILADFSISDTARMLHYLLRMIATMQRADAAFGDARERGRNGIEETLG